MTVHGPIDYSDNPYDSVHSLMKKFVVDLQINYPATIATILRTGDKLSLDQNIQINEKCKLCKVNKVLQIDIFYVSDGTTFRHQ